MNNYNETEELKGLEASQVNGGDYNQGHNLGAAVRNLITEVGDAVGGFFAGLAGY